MYQNNRKQVMDQLAKKRTDAICSLGIFILGIVICGMIMYQRSQSREAYQKGYEAGKQEMIQHYDSQAAYQIQQIEEFENHSEIKP